MSERKPIFDKLFFQNGSARIKEKRAGATTAEKAKINLAYLKLFAVLALLGFSNLMDKIFPNQREE